MVIYLSPITVSDELWLARLISYVISGREDAFWDGVRARDMKCVITGVRKRIAGVMLQIEEKCSYRRCTKRL